MPTAGVLPPWQVRQQVRQPILMPAPAPRTNTRSNTEPNAARKQRRKAQKCRAADAANASAADASAPAIPSGPSIHPSLFETKAKYRPNPLTSARALKRKAERAARFPDDDSVPDANPDDNPDDPTPTKSPSPASYDFPLPEPEQLINPQNFDFEELSTADSCAILSPCASSATDSDADSDAPSGPRASATLRPAARSYAFALRLGHRPAPSAACADQRGK